MEIKWSADYKWRNRKFKIDLIVWKSYLQTNIKTKENSV